MTEATRTPLDPNAALALSGGVFGPGVPLTPEPGLPARAWDFQVGTNTNLTVRAYETSPKALRAWANVEIIRLCIETRKDQVEALKWGIRLKGGKKPTDADRARIEKVKAFWERPDGFTDFSTWLRLSLEDVFVGDWPAWEKRRTRGGQFIGLDVLPGDTIHPLVDSTGRRPKGQDEIAYQQVIKGRPWVNMTNGELLYAPRNPRPGHNYGMSPVEQVIVTINTFMRRQAMQLAHFTEGNVPAGFLTGPEGWTPEQIEAMQKSLDLALAGNPADKSKLRFMPFGTKYQAFKDPALKDDFDEWLARVACFAFSLPPTPFIKQMNRSTGETDKERAQEEGLAPIKLWFKRVADGVNATDLGEGDLEFFWDDQVEVDPNIQSQIDDRDLKSGLRTLDEIRERRGDDAYGEGVGDKPMIYITTGAVLVEEAIKPPEPPPELVPPDGSVPPQGPKGAAKDPAGKPDQADGKGNAVSHTAKPKPNTVSKLEKSAKKPIGLDRPVPRRAIKGLAKSAAIVLQATADSVAAEVARRLRGLHKAADDNSDPIIAANIAAAVDLSELGKLEADAFDDLFDVYLDSATAGLAQVGVATSDDLTNKVNQAAVDWARERAANMVAVDGDQNIIDATREAIRRVIADGLAENIGTPAIADAIQADRGFSQARADLIAHTEVADANSTAVLDSFKRAAAMGISLMKTWETSGSDCCDECTANEDQGPIPLDEDFQSGDDAPTAHPNCACCLNSALGEPGESDGADDGED
jgi:hypothetical protein